MLLIKLLHKFKSIGIKWMMASLNKDVSGLFVLLNKEYNYVVCKIENRQDPRFPYSFLIDSEVDILCYQDDVMNISKIVKQWLANKYHHLSWVEVSEEISNDHSLVYVYVCGMNHKYRCFCVDIQTASSFCMSQDSLSSYIQNRILSSNGMCYINSPKYEIPIRAYELLSHPHKIWHKDYIIMKKSDIDYSVLDLAYSNNQELLTNLKSLIHSCA